MTNEEMAHQIVQQHLVLVAQQMHQVTRITSEILTQFCDDLVARMRASFPPLPTEHMPPAHTGSHTPGPWRVGAGSYVISDNPAPGIGGSDAIIGYGGHLICESVNPQNARLIAAAPDLLEACKAVLVLPAVDESTAARLQQVIEQAESVV